MMDIEFSSLTALLPAKVNLFDKHFEVGPVSLKPCFVMQWVELKKEKMRFVYKTQDFESLHGV